MREQKVAGVVAVLTLIISILVHRLLNFEYSLFEDEVDLALLVVDIGSFLVIFLCTFTILNAYRG
ncbi:hypothetical protein [Peribacillus sp. SCS-155]|uniref:hypothetical protein n=1 Tax=Peribacillus sedimenti TaxID=3115297 RepID=UPI0039063296